MRRTARWGSGGGSRCGILSGLSLIITCHQALEINAYHFMAASVMGQAYLLLGDPVSALDSFRRALRLNPNMEEVRAQVIHLQRSLKDEK